MKKPTSGYLYIFLSVFLYGLYGIYTRNISEAFSPFTLNIFRESLTALLILIIILVGLVKWVKIEKVDIKYLLILGLLSTLANVAMYYSYTLLPIGIAGFTTFSSTIISSAILGMLLLKEKITKFDIFSIVLLISGLLLMFQIKTAVLSLIGIIIGLSFGFFIALYAVFIKKLKGEYSSLQIYMICAFIVVFFSIFISFLLKEPFPETTFDISWIWVILFSVSALLANGLYILGLRKKINISTAGIIMPMEAVVAAITGIIFFQEGFNIRVILGAVIILFASILTPVIEIVKNKNAV